MIFAAYGGWVAERERLRATDLPVLRTVKARWYASRLEHDDAEIRKESWQGLGRMGPRAAAAVSGLIDALDSEYPEVRDEAIWVLGKIGPAAEPAVNRLVQLQEERLARHRKGDFRSQNIEKALGRIGVAGMRPFIADLEEANAATRARGVKTLQGIVLVTEDKELLREAMPALVGALGDEDDEVRKASALALGACLRRAQESEDCSTVICPLVAAMNDRRAASAARGALLGIRVEVVVRELEKQIAGDGPRYSLLHPDSSTAERLLHLVAEREEIGGYAVFALGKLGQGALGPALDGLHSDDVEVRRSSAEAMQLILPKAKDKKLRKAAEQALIRALDDEHLRPYVAEALKRTESESARKALQNAGTMP